MKRPRLRARRIGDFRLITLSLGDKVITIAGTGITFAKLYAALQTFGVSPLPSLPRATARDRRRRKRKS